MSTDDSSPKIHRPKPLRPFEPSLLSPAQPDETPSRTHSILNLTSSTLLGIYSQTGYQSDRDYTEPSTPWGTGAETPSCNSPALAGIRSKVRVPPPPPPSLTSTISSLVVRSILLFGTGMGYGALVRHLHSDRKLAPFQVPDIIKPRHDWRYLVFWGLAGVALGSLLPWFDSFCASRESENSNSDYSAAGGRNASPTKLAQGEAEESSSIFSGDWTPVIRSVGAFVGIAFAIRKLPWASSLQASLTLFLVNPALWYLIDRSTPGFVLSSAVGATGTALLLASNPDMMPSPASSLHKTNTTANPNDIMGGMIGMGIDEYVSRESIECGIWILSVLFCSTVCFGNIGRRLALSGVGGRRDRRGWGQKSA
ncbi:Uncharacterized protein BP5553_01360 [Venustampulla echinocandica]|uniref:Uncharacterized protein n=1 Tax=Venustampulla echinocandica TaxID=2656787 RepID=A0A370U0T0_9HELO|nr:Uncharacterized protein BP5553_01360 [Venustampulla echinocandica]RDL41381.1 Uncharacterized protein BP5553_01360 [Venustampulla echinocandica]